MKTLFLLIILLFSYSVGCASTDKVGGKVKFSKCYEYQESVKDFRKDRYPDFVYMQLYKVQNIFILEVLKKDKSGLLYILTDSDLEKIKSTTPISQNNNYYIEGERIKKK